MSTIGIRNSTLKTADTAVAASVALVSIGLASPIAANQTQKLRWWIPFSVGAAGGVRAQIVVPAGGVVFISTITLNNVVAPATVIATQTASAAFTNAVANAGTHFIEIEATIVNGATAGNVDLQMAQNTSDATPMTALRGGSCDVIKH